MTIQGQTYTVKEVGEAVGVSASSIRAWCAEFRDNLSPGATPANGQTRQFTAADVATLQQVRQLRSQGLTYDQIISRLAMDPDDLPDHHTIFVAGPDPLPTALQTAQDSPTDVTALTAALHLLRAVDERTAPLQARLDALQTQQATKLTWLVVGFILGLLAALVAAGLLALVR